MENTSVPEKINDIEKFEISKGLKAEGNELFKSQKYKQATGKYHRALLYLKGIGQPDVAGLFLPIGTSGESHASDLPKDLMDEVGRLKADCYNNLSACLLQVEVPNYDKIIQYCDNVLEAQSNNIKAIYRKGLSLYHKRCFDEAMDVLNEAANSPQGAKDPLVRKYIQLCKKEQAKQEEVLKETYKGMFGTKDKELKIIENS